MHKLCLALVAITSVAHADDKKHTLADLKALVSQNAFKEALQHLGDIPPAQRNADWVDVAATASGGFLGTVSASDAFGIIDQIDREYPQILKSAKYTGPRGELGTKGLASCLQDTDGSPECVAIGLRFVDNSGGDRALALKVAKVVRVGTGSATAVPFFKRAFGGKDNAAVCKDEDLKIAVVAGLGLPPDEANATESKVIMGTCWDSLKDAVVAAFDSDSGGGNVHRNTCDTLKAKKMLSSLQEKQCAKK